MIVLLAALALAAPRAAVLSAGNDPARAGALQRSVESKIESLPAAEVARLLGVRDSFQPVSGIEPAVRAKADSLLADARKAYVEDSLVAALDSLGQLAALHAQYPQFPRAERVNLLLWRASVFLRDDNRARALGEARAALGLQPDLAVDFDVFRPSLGTLVEEARAKGPKMVTVTLQGLPPGAEVFVDDRETGTLRIAVPEGSHRIRVRAPGFRTVERSLEARADGTVWIGMPVAFDPKIAKLLLSITSPSAAAAERRALGKIADRLGVDTLVILAGTENDSRATVWRAGDAQTSPSQPADSAGDAAIAQWVAVALASTPGSTPGAVSTPVSAMTTPVPVRTPAPIVRAPRAARDPDGWLIDTEGGLALASRSMKVSGSGGAGFKGGFTGAGVRVSAELARGSHVAQLDGRWTSWNLGSAKVDRPDGGTSSIDGGSTQTFRAGWGWRIGGEDAMSFVPGIGATFEDHRANDLRDVSGPLGLFPSHTRISPDVRLGWRMPLSAIIVRASLAVSGFGYVSERPTGSTGDSPRDLPGFALSAGGSWRPAPASRFVVGVSYDGEQRRTGFSGEARAPLDPRLRKAQVSETVHAVTLAARMSF